MTLPADNVLETARLILRPTRLEDFEPWAALTADDEVMAFLGGAKPRSVAWRGLMTTAGAWSLQGFSMFSVIEKSSGRWIGRVGPLNPEGWPGTEVGWAVARDTWGKGYATEAATAAIDWAFAHLCWDEVIHCIDPGNFASKKVAARLGSSLLGLTELPAPYDGPPLEKWGQSRAQWEGRRRSR